MTPDTIIADAGSVPLRPDLPVSLVLGAGGVRGLAHVGALDVLLRGGFEVTDIAGSSVGALIGAFYAAVGLDAGELARAGHELRSRHVLSWALVRGAPPWVRRLGLRCCGRIPEYLEQVGGATFARLHHGVRRLTIVAFDVTTGDLVICDGRSQIDVADAMRGAVAIPGVFPPRHCTDRGRELRLADAGGINGLPVEVLFRDGVAPAQIVAIDISGSPAGRARNREKIARLRREHPRLPIAVLYPQTLGEGTLVYSRGVPGKLFEAGRAASRQLISGRTDRRPAEALRDAAIAEPA
ncbi:MAG TPA: patatin-like phospholipase family protein [Vicinamibacterales bacterium]|nr:patatin-like phospholipase family protein [Vicinamibacterales bacterium]